jgi:predicted metallo-beta-lactamase superfamily hydrolase
VRAVTFDDGTASVIHSSDVDGEYVLHADYARLKAEVERLKNTDPDSITGSTIIDDPAWSIACFRFHRENERAEIKRLLKAGDNLERVLTTKVASYEIANASHEWRAAKEGKQP